MYFYKSVYTLLSAGYPDRTWKKSKFVKKKRANQRLVYALTQKIFPKLEVIEEYYHAELSRISGQIISFDVFIPALNLAIEYHGIQHYEDMPVFGNLEIFRERDKEKALLCKEHNIRVLVVPYWLTLTQTNLENLLRQEQSDLQ